MFYVVGQPVAHIFELMKDFLNNMGTTNAVLMGIILASMMCIDLGGPINKAAYAFTVGLLTTNTYMPMAATMAGGMVPAIGMAIATFLARNKCTQAFKASSRRTVPKVIVIRVNDIEIAKQVKEIYKTEGFNIQLINSKEISNPSCKELLSLERINTEYDAVICTSILDEAINLKITMMRLIVSILLVVVLILKKLFSL